MRDLQLKQMHKEVKMVQANNASDIKDPYFKEDYGDWMIEQTELHLFHVAIESRSFKSVGVTPERISVPRIQKYSPEVFAALNKGQGFTGMVVHVLHNPEKTTAGSNNEKGLKVINGIGEAKEELLLANGVKTIEKLSSLTDAELTSLDEVDGLSATELAQWVADAKTLLQ